VTFAKSILQNVRWLAGTIIYITWLQVLPNAGFAQDITPPSGFVVYETNSITRTHEHQNAVRVIYQRPDKPNLEAIQHGRTFACADGARHIVNVKASETGTIKTDMTALFSQDTMIAKNDRFLSNTPKALKRMIDKYETEKPERQQYDAVSQGSLVDYVETDNGFLAGFNRGEWGGSLIWFPHEGSPQVISGKHTNHILSVGDRAFVAQGNVHFGIGKGIISVFKWQDKTWQSEAGFLKESITFPTTIKKVLFQDNIIIGLMSGMPVIVGMDGTVTYSRFWKEQGVQRAISIAMDKNKRIWIEGENQLGVWHDPAKLSDYTLYIRENCKPQDWEIAPGR